jgi:hypothetical protein
MLSLELAAGTVPTSESGRNGEIRTSDYASRKFAVAIEQHGVVWEYAIIACPAVNVETDAETAVAAQTAV